jgi:hypothetical protein
LEAAKVRAEIEIEMCRLHEKELMVQEQQLKWQKSRDTRERERQQTPAAQVKFFGDVLKNVMPQFPVDVADTPTFFDGVEKLFANFKVSVDLRAKLLLP